MTGKMTAFSRLWALVLSASAAFAFRDTSPFMLFSTSDILLSLPRFASASSISESLSSTLSTCPSDVYVIAHQPGVSFVDYSEAISTPHLKEWMTGDSKKVRSTAYTAELQGTIEPADLVRIIKDKCGAESLSIDASTGYLDTVVDGSKKPQVVTIDFMAPFNMDKRSQALRTNDLFLYNFLESLPASTKFTVLYTTTPPAVARSLHAEKPATYEMDDSMSPMHVDLKRDLSFDKRQDSDNITLVDGPLFERYQFLTPGIFMGGLAMFFLLSISFVGVSALQSLQVSYSAFDKENGPAAQRKQQ